MGVLFVHWAQSPGEDYTMAGWAPPATLLDHNTLWRALQWKDTKAQLLGVIFIEEQQLKSGVVSQPLDSKQHTSPNTGYWIHKT